MREVVIMREGGHHEGGVVNMREVVIMREGW